MYLTLGQSENRAVMIPILMQALRRHDVGNYQKLTSANAFVYQVGEDYVKFPNMLRAEKALRREIELSNFLSKRVSFSVPYFEYGQITTCLNGADYNLFFAKSKKIRGIPLYQATMRAIPHTTFATSLVDVLEELHSINITDISALGVPSFKARIGKLMGTVIQSDQTHLKTKKSIFNKIRSQLGANEKDVLCHRDLHGANIFVNPLSGVVTGVLDFGMAEVAPPAIEIADMSVYANMGLVSRIAEMYRMKTGRDLGNLYLYHAGDRNKWLQGLITSCAKELNVPIKIISNQISRVEKHGRVNG